MFTLDILRMKPAWHEHLQNIKGAERFLVLVALRRCAVVFHQLYKASHTASAHLPAVHVYKLLHLHGIRLQIQLGSTEDNTRYPLVFKLGQLVY